MKEFLYEILIPITMVICSISATTLITALAFFIIKDEIKNR
jgi:uncharacterized membrane protein YozB (DUF420 family)